MLLVAAALAAAPEIPFTRYTLDNGLQVILSPDDSVPYTWVNLWYYVGSKDEQPGKTGFAHLFEHMMFQGSANSDGEYFEPLQAVGAQINGTTTTDRTNFFEGVPSHQIPLALFMESDRMGWLLDALTPEKFTNQQDVVRNERRQRYENRPYGKAFMYLMEAMYPEGHPYHHPVIGSHEDLANASIDDVKSFFRQWYVPNNASLVICGAYNETEARAQVQKWFGEVPAGAEPPITTAPPITLTETRTLIKNERVPFPKVWIAWPTPPILTQEDADLDLLAHILTDGADARLTQALVYQQKIAQDVRAYQSSSKLQSMFVIEATAAQGQTADALITAIDTILAELKITKTEVDLARTGYMVQFYDSLESISGKANLLNHYNFLTGDPGYMSQDIARYQRSKKRNVINALTTWLPLDRRIVLHILPEAK